jgi:hypothetical protein
LNNEPVAWTACLDCGKRVTGDSIHTCSPQLKTLTDEEIIKELESEIERLQDQLNEFLVAKDLAILRKAQEK